MTRCYTMLLLFMIPGILLPQDQDLLAVYPRPSQSLNGEWRVIVDPYENGFYSYRYEPFENAENPPRGAYFTNSKPRNKSDLIEYDFDSSEILNVPGDWNSQDEKLFYYEGTVWYKKSFDYQKKGPQNRVFVYFGAVNYQADVYLNGQKVGRHTGGFTPFNFEITDLLREKDNFLILKVDNKRLREGVPTLNTDWWNYGGITRDVKLVETPPVFIRNYFVRLAPESRNKIRAEVALGGEGGAGEAVTVKIPGLKIEETMTAGENGMAAFYLPAKDLKKWTPESPRLYDITLIAGQDTVRDRVGFRTIATRGQDILLNGKPVFLRGICIHEESPLHGGRATNEADARKLLGWAKDLGCNYVRLAHYPHNEYMLRMADEMGVMVWGEIPVYWTIDWENEKTYQNAESQLTAMIERDRNRAAVVIWSMANETPNSDARLRFMRRLAQRARTLDGTRLISAALEQSRVAGPGDVRTISDPFAEDVDVLSFNQYIGWYEGLPEKCRQVTWQISQDKPVLISEFGAGAKQGFHGDALTRWSEEYQADLYRQTLEMLSQIPQLRGLSPWILVDFRSPRRSLPGIQDGWNRKGLISEDGQRKQAFGVLQAFYQKK